MAGELDSIEHISDLLASGNIKDVKEIINNDSFVSILEEKCSDIIVITSYYLNEKSIQENPARARCCKKLLTKCAEYGHPKECLMEFLAQIESLDDVKFDILLGPIQTVLLRITGTKDKLLQSVVHVIYRFINSLPVPQYHHFDKHSSILLDTDERTERIIDFYRLIVQFYEPFVNKYCGEKTINSVLIQGLIQLLGNPVIYLDLEQRENGCSPIRDVAMKIIKLILKLKSDPVEFLLLVEDKQLITVEEEKLLVRESSYGFKLTDLSLSVFFYLIFHEKMADKIPCAYSKLFKFRNCLHLAAALLQYQETMVLKKGLLLTNVAVDHIEPTSVDSTFLADDVHKQIVNLLSNIAVYQEVEENRKLAVDLLRKHFFSFEPKAQFSILLNINIAVQHPNIVGFVMTLLTTSVQRIFVDDRFCEYFTGKRLFDIMSKYCILKKEAETDLVESKDQILSALNLIIYLTKRDRNNFSGIWDYLDILSQRLFVPLREGINLSRAHYEMQIKSLDDPLKTEDGADFAVSVGGQELDRMSKTDKRAVMNMGLTVFDLIEHLLTRAIYCVEDKPHYE